MKYRQVLFLTVFLVFFAGTARGDFFTIFAPEGLTGGFFVPLNPCNELDATGYCRVFAFHFPDFWSPVASSFECSGQCTGLYYIPGELDGTVRGPVTLDVLSFSGNEATVSSPYSTVEFPYTLSPEPAGAGMATLLIGILSALGWARRRRGSV